MDTNNPHDAYMEGKDQQARIIAAKPDFTREQWIAAAEEVKQDMAAAVARVERLRGRLDAIGLHFAFGKPSGDA